MGIKKLFQRVRNQREILRFFISFLITKKLVILALFLNFEAKRAKNSSKNQKTFLVNVSQISILHPIKGSVFFILKKKSNSLYPSVQCTVYNKNCTITQSPPSFCLFLSNLSLIYEVAIGQPKQTTSLCDCPRPPKSKHFEIAEQGKRFFQVEK